MLLGTDTHKFTAYEIFLDSGEFRKKTVPCLISSIATLSPVQSRVTSLSSESSSFNNSVLVVVIFARLTISTGVANLTAAGFLVQS